MINYEFDVHYDKLVTANPKGYASEAKKESVKKAVKDLDKQWFLKAVRKIVTEAKVGKFLDIEELAKSQRFAESRVNDTKMFIAGLEANEKLITQTGYKKFLEKYGATDAVDAIKKLREGNCESTVSTDSSIFETEAPIGQQDSGGVCDGT